MSLVSYEQRGEHLVPIAVRQRSDGSIFSKIDITRVDLEKMRRNDDPVKGGWLMLQSNSANSWNRRYVMIRGNFLFYFQATRDSNPEGVVPLESTEILVPKGGEMTFEKRTREQHSTGFEFDIFHPQVNEP